MIKKMTLIITVGAVLFIGFVMIFVNKSMANNQSSMAGMPGMSQNGEKKETSQEVKSITQSELVKYLDQSDVTIVDLREPVAFRKSHIPNSINIPFADFQDRFHELDSNKLIVLVCHVGSMGEASGQLLLQQGFKHVDNLTGGMAKWSGPVAN